MNAAINGHPDAKSRMLMLNKMLEQSKQGCSTQKSGQDGNRLDRGQTAKDRQ